MDSSITSYDVAAGHIITQVTATTGDYVAAIAVGTVIYITYSISGNEMLLSMDETGTAYPVTATGGPYIKQ